MNGILPAIITPFDSDEAFAQAPFEQLIERLYTAGVHGLYVCGSTGEGTVQPLADRQRVAEVAIKNSPSGKQVMVHVGAASTQDAVTLARHAARTGATAISALPPSGFYSFAEVKTYYERIAQAVEIPVYVYYFPEMSSAISTLDQINELCQIPHVAGLKFTDFDLYRMSLITRSGPKVFNGRDEVFIAGMLMGACGGIGTFYNLLPKEFVTMYDLCQAGQWAEARQIQDRVNDLIRLSLRFPYLAAVKQILTWSGLPAGPCHSPKRNLTPDEQTALRQALLAAEFDPASLMRIP